MLMGLQGRGRAGGGRGGVMDPLCVNDWTFVVGNVAETQECWMLLAALLYKVKAGVGGPVCNNVHLSATALGIHVPS